MSLVLVFLCLWMPAEAQHLSKPQRPENVQPTGFKPEDFVPAVDLRRTGYEAPGSTFFVQTLPTLQRPVSQGYMHIMARNEEGLPIFIKGKLPSSQRGLSAEEQALAFLQQNAKAMQLDTEKESFELLRSNTDELGMQHFSFRQTHQGIPVYAAEIKIHCKNGQAFALNGRYQPIEENLPNHPQIESAYALNVARHIVQETHGLSQTDLPEYLRQEDKIELVVFAPQLYLPKGSTKMDTDRKAELCWKIDLSADAIHRYRLFISAESGKLLHMTELSCSFLPKNRMAFAERQKKTSPFIGSEEKSALENLLPPGPVTAQATDLKGVTRTLHVYELGGTYYMIDASRDMFSAAASNLPDDPAGVIWTLNAQNTNPQNGNFTVSQVSSGNNQWNNPTSVSAHYNAQTCFEYFYDKFGRNSINGQGGNVISLINVSETDGTGMDNAFWSGTAMFYGNGNQAFTSPLCKALDVGGHEMSHGVIGSTANLIYEAQSGALNESFADVFGVLIDPANWQLGEDVVNPAYFPTGALRDMSNPHNGGSGPNDPSWQPAHMNEYQNLPVNPQNDNGGVHINSGIPNRAFYLFASAVGNSKAEQVYYRALTQYLNASSQFIDCRLAVLQATEDLYGAGSSEVNAAASAFDQVGITGSNGTNTQGELGTNPGPDYVLLTDLNNQGIYLYDGQNFPQLSTTGIISRPSVTDDGSVIVFVAADQTLRSLIFNNATGLYEEYYIENNPQQIWRNIAISKDGSKIAALTTDYDNTIFVYDYNSGQGQNFELYTPTSGGTITYDVQYADVLEWDYSGEHIMYDAYNVLASGIDYWDISFIRAWDKQSNSFGDGFINKLFNALPENSSVGNPVFSKNSPFIIALDFLDGSSGFGTDYFVLGVNLQTGDVGTLVENNTLGWPHYSIDDGALIFDMLDLSSALQISIVDVAADKISSTSTPQDFIYGGHWGVWYALGDRPLVHTQESAAKIEHLQLSPNPTSKSVHILWEGQDKPRSVQVSLYDLNGRLILKQEAQYLPNQALEFLLPDLPSGQYSLQLLAGERRATATLHIE